MNDTTYARQHPIYGTDFTKPLSALIEDHRRTLANVRGQLGDIRAAFPGWGEQIEPIIGLLTCGLITLFYLRDEMLKVEQERAAKLASKEEIR